MTLHARQVSMIHERHITFVRKLLLYFFHFQKTLEVAKKRKWKLICLGFFDSISIIVTLCGYCPVLCIPINVTDVVEGVLVFLEVTSFLSQDTRQSFFCFGSGTGRRSVFWTALVFFNKERHGDILLFCYLIRYEYFFMSLSTGDDKVAKN